MTQLTPSEQDDLWEKILADVIQEGKQAKRYQPRHTRKEMTWRHKLSSAIKQLFSVLKEESWRLSKPSDR